MPVEDNGPVIDPKDGLRIAVEFNRVDNAARMRPPTAFLLARLQATCEAFLERYGEDEEAEE